GPLTFSGMWEGRPYEDLGTVLEVEAPRRLSYTHWSALSGTPNTPEHQHTLVFTLDEHDGRTSVALTQDNAATEEERNHSAAMWVMVLDGLKARRGRGGVGAAGDARVRRVKHRSSEGLNAE
ncbi:MAG: SRPBCC domain-containing protein, partial [Dehalococcoidia bacterium]|nr:SRPBCC domain-containing protein [Dehalococcoidia bacterium]